MASTKKHDDNYYGMVIIGIVIAIGGLVYLLSSLKSGTPSKAEAEPESLEVVTLAPEPPSSPAVSPSVPSALGAAVPDSAKGRLSVDPASPASAVASRAALNHANEVHSHYSSEQGAFAAPAQPLVADPPADPLDAYVDVADRRDFLVRLEQISRGDQDREHFRQPSALLSFSERVRTHQVSFGFAESVKKIVAHLPSETVTSDAVVVRMLHDQHSARVFIVRPKRFDESVALTLVEGQKPDAGQYQVLIYQADAEAALIAKGKFDVGQRGL